MYIDDCIKGTMRVFNSDFKELLMLEEEQVSINQLIQYIEEIAQYKISKKYLLDKPKGVRGRTSDNTLIKNKIGWDTEISLKEGLKKTYKWIYDQHVSGSNINKYTKSNI